MRLGQQIAREKNLEFVGSEHVLLGILEEGTGAGALLLKEAGLTRTKIRQELQRLAAQQMEETWVVGRLPGTPHFMNVIAKAIEQARNAGVSIDAVAGDLEGDYRIQPDTWDVIMCFNYLHRPLFPSIRNGIKPGGMIVYETYIIDQMAFGKPHNPDFLLRHNELLDEFRNFRCLRYHEGILGPEKAVAGIITQKPVLS